ncbi:MAG: phosphoglucosamine mutase, partial [Synergistaceae bacterium]|nr:phosphoglucosamine mutase [Synergistaceae bacterium]
HLASLVRRRDLLPSSTVFDCAHGAAGAVMPFLEERLGVKWPLIGADPDGLNINEGVGVIHIRHLSNHVTEFGYKMGFAYDGDADRVLAVDSGGRVIDGDIAIWLLARWLASRGDLGNGVVVTSMSNMALEEHLGRENIRVFRCPVGDRYVLEGMRRHGARLGGEQSGHIIADSFTRTGDGLCTALMLLNALQDLDEDLDTLVDRFGRYPQRLSNLEVAVDRVIDMDFVRSISGDMERRMRGSGRVMIRPSGTEPLLRILVEARERAMVEEISEYLVDALRAHCS